MNLVFDPETIYDTLRVSFPILYKEPKQIKPAKLMQVFHFVSPSVFKIHIPKEYFKASIIETMKDFEPKIKMFLEIVIPCLAKGFSIQRGSLYVFDPDAQKDMDDL